MTPHGKHVLGIVAKAYVTLAIAYCVYVWTAGQNPRTGSLRTAIAVIGFGLCVWLPERFTENRFAVPLLMVFGVVGTTVMVFIVHTQGAQ